MNYNAVYALLVEIACSLDDFSTLCSAIEAAGLADALSSGHWTVFAPTNAAFDALGDLLDTVLADTALLTDILLFHAVDDAVSSKDLECAATVEMANLQNSRTVCEGGKIYQKGGSNPRNDMPQIIQTDIKTCQGYIHVIGTYIVQHGRIAKRRLLPKWAVIGFFVFCLISNPFVSSLASLVDHSSYCR